MGVLSVLVACGGDEALVLSHTAQALTVNPTSQNFSDVVVGQTATRTTTISETTATMQTVQSVSETCAEFTQSGEVVYAVNGVEQSRMAASYPVSVYRFVDTEAGTIETQVLELDLTFSPADRGVANCTVNVDMAAGADPTITLQGTGVAAQLDTTPSNLAFTSRRIGTMSATQSFIVTNSGDTGNPLTISSLVVSPNDADWVITFDTSTPIAAGGSRTGTVAFAPKAAGSRTATLTITGTDPVDSTETIILAGTGLTATVSVASNTLSIGNVVVGDDATGNVTVNNTAVTNGTTLTVEAVTFAGPNAGDFSVVSPTLPATINANTSGTIVVQCVPSGTGVRTAVMTIDTDADNVPQDPTVDVSCTGQKPDISIAPTSLTFGATTIGNAVDLTTTISNANGTYASPLTVDSFEITGTHASDFMVISPTAPFTLAAGGNQVVTVRFTPTASGSRTGTLVITSDDQETPMTTVSFAGTASGGAPEITIAEPAGAAITFGAIKVGTTSSAIDVVVENDGTAALDITSVSLTGADAAQFELVGATSTSVAATATASWSVTCKPTTAGAFATSLTIASSDADEPTTSVALSCSGSAAMLALASPRAPVELADTRVGEDTEVTLTFENVGDAVLTIQNASTSRSELSVSAFPTAPPFDLGPGETTTLGLTFSPSESGDIDGTIDVAWDTDTLSVQARGKGTDKDEGCRVGGGTSPTLLLVFGVLLRRRRRR